MTLPTVRAVAAETTTITPAKSLLSNRHLGSSYDIAVNRIKTTPAKPYLKRSFKLKSFIRYSVV
jgi:hypothetical protein